MREIQVEGLTCPTCGNPLTLIQTHNLVGQILDGRYEILEVLGKGGMGVVYRGRHRFLDREVAVKVLRADAAEETRSVARFLQEAKRTSSLTSPNTVRVTDFGVTSEGSLYLVMELLVGRSLAAILASERKLDWLRMFGFAVQVCNSLAEAHEKGILHRDIKPDNIFIATDAAGRETVKVLDFGISKWAEANESITFTGTICGTPEYISPEQARGQDVDGKADIYSLGAVLYQALSGQTPFTAESRVTVMMSHIMDKPIPLNELDPSLPQIVSDLVMWTLKKKPGRRPANVAVLRDCLQSMLDKARSPASPGTQTKAPLADGAPAPAEALLQSIGEEATVDVSAGRLSLTSTRMTSSCRKNELRRSWKAARPARCPP